MYELGRNKKKLHIYGSYLENFNRMSVKRERFDILYCSFTPVAKMERLFAKFYESNNL